MSPKASESGDLYVKYNRSFHLSFCLRMINWRKPMLQAYISVSTSEFRMESTQAPKLWISLLQKK